MSPQPAIKTLNVVWSTLRVPIVIGLRTRLRAPDGGPHVLRLHRSPIVSPVPEVSPISFRPRGLHRSAPRRVPASTAAPLDFIIPGSLLPAPISSLGCTYTVASYLEHPNICPPFISNQRLLFRPALITTMAIYSIIVSGIYILTYFPGAPIIPFLYAANASAPLPC
jgi:hypothetical protein